MGRDTQTMVGAWNLWDRAVADGRIASVAEPAGLEAEFRVPLSIAQPFAQSLGGCLSPGLCVCRRAKAGYL